MKPQTSPGGMGFVSPMLHGFRILGRNAIITLAIFGLCYQVGCSSSTDPEPTPPPPDVSCGDTPGSICTWAGTGKAAFDGDGHKLLESYFYFPHDLTFTSTGVYILDWNNHRVRHLTAQGVLETVVGTALLGDGDPNFDDRTPPGALGTLIDLNHPTEVDELPNGDILLTSWHNHKLRIYNPSTGYAYVSCGAGAGFDGDGGPATDAHLNQASASVVLSDGTIYVLDQRNQRVRMITPGGMISTVVGTGVSGFSGDGGPPTNAQLSFPTGSNPPPGGGLAVDNQGRLYISDTLNHRVRRADFNANTIETVVGNGIGGYGGDGLPAVSASINNPRDLEFGPDGRLYIADEANNRIRAVDLTTGIITTVAGNGNVGSKGDGGPAVDAELNSPTGIAFDSNGYLYIADYANHKIRRVTL